MIRRLVSAAKRNLGLEIAGSHLAVYPDDTFIMSYPRSGNTWIRFLLTNLLHPEIPATFELMERTVPDTTAQSRRFFDGVPRPRLIKGHHSFDPRIKRVIYVVRDPRDVAVSFYHFQRKYRIIDDKLPLEGYVQRFVSGEVSDFGSWGEHVASWLAARYGSPDFILIRYLDLKTETMAELGRIAEFLKIDADEQRLSQAIERSSTERMRKQEKIEQDTWVATRGKRKDVAFIGPAKAGNWKAALPPTSVASIESAWGPLMKALGYELTHADEASLLTPFFAPGFRFGHGSTGERNSRN
jgi:Sulfotransferase domain